MNQYECKLLERREVAEDTMAFWLKTPDGFQFKAGQHADFTILNPPQTDEKGNTRTFSFASSPNNKDSFILATRMRDSAFKEGLKTVPLGTVVKVTQSTGFFTLHEDGSRPAVFLAGGIGVTPMRSIVEWATQEKLPHKIYLFYSNKAPKETAFLQDFENWEKQNPNFKLIATVTQTKSPSWKYEFGRVDKSMLTKYVGELGGPIYYISGPHDMLVSIYEMLIAAGVERDSIKTEEFTGY